MSSAEGVEMFMSVTGASQEKAQQYLQASGMDVQQAILTYLEAGEEPGDAAAAPAAQAPAAAAAAAPSAPPGSIDSILGQANQNNSKKDGEAGKGSGKQSSSKDDSFQRKVGLVFFADGFMVEEDMEEDEEEEEATPEAPKPPTRRIGMMSLADLAPESGGQRPKLPKKIPTLSPLRSYDTPENRQFLDDVKAGKVPKALQKRDEKGRPVPTTFAVSDHRPKTYVELEKTLDELRKMKDEQEAEDKQKAPPPSTLFTGAGQSLGSSATASAAGSSSGTGACDPTLLALVNAGKTPVVDESKPATNLQLRLSTGARVKARLNLDHTVADLWRLVADAIGPAFATTSGHELCAGFPPKPLTNSSATLAAADLANAAVTHRCR